ncbi:hypothetical protein RO3G_00939 [Rhizopus delemar RA 99-880]|uniref:Uncharacterized protein n=1 Tax=Rhizopus delemar (strain RA 99-880 / ATCC MYA-4621 / FGSC 9543 / NRRL 43880) TaxID=246409 RepID=I1BJ55_RHIO9|nr:hypothetical protein RO3G_00939 [Rhizopus delemar RA 99-880]|eukprot:EIE76235.1 hypothetical protein RO3G_00939 [Rhizopus delemar RA 99-880]
MISNAFTVQQCTKRTKCSIIESLGTLQNEATDLGASDILLNSINVAKIESEDGEKERMTEIRKQRQEY